MNCSSAQDYLFITSPLQRFYPSQVSRLRVFTITDLSIIEYLMRIAYTHALKTRQFLPIKLSSDLLGLSLLHIAQHSRLKIQPFFITLFV